MRATGWLVLAVLLACAATSFVIVDETEHVVVTQFGKPTAVYSDAGLRMKAPSPIQRVSRIDKRRLLKYRGRLDEGRTAPPPAGARRELLEAMRAIARGDQPPGEQMPSIGCSIKWKERR